MFFTSISLVIIAIIVTAIFGLRLGVDFKGGSIVEIVFEQRRPDSTDLSKIISSVKGTSEISISPFDPNGATVRLNAVSEQTHQELLQAISEKFGKITENRFDSIGPVVGRELEQKSITAIIVLLLAIVVYIAFVFRKLSRVLSPWAMGVAAIVALIHDIIIPVGIFSLLGHYLKIDIGVVFVAAALTILGYSVSDTVIVFDRVRENVLRFGSRESFGEIVHKSIKQTLVRSLNSTFATLLSLIAIYFFGGTSLKYFSLALIVGIFFGAYSSFFVASPILVWWSGLGRKKA